MENGEKIWNYGDIICFTEIRNFITLVNMEKQRKFLFLGFYESFITLKYMFPMLHLANDKISL